MFNKYTFMLVFFLFSINLAAQSKADWIQIMTSEVGLDDARGARIYITDLNNDNYPDFVYSGPGAYKEPLTVMLNEKSGDSRVFTDKTEYSNINYSRFGLDERWSDVSVFGDIDNDGDADLITGVFFYKLEEYMYKDTVDGQIYDKIRDDQKFEVLLNDGTGKFDIVEQNGLTDFQFVTETIRGGTVDYPAGLVSTTGMSLIDFDRDGNLDLVIGTFMLDYSNNYKARQYLMKGNGDGTFSYYYSEGIESVREPLYGLNTTDYNNDGLMDIVSSPYCRSDGSIWQNNGDGTFTDVGHMVNYSANHMNRDDSPNANLCQWESMPADFDNDGDIDLLQVLVHGGYDNGVGRTTIAANQGPENNFRYEWEIDRLQREAPAYSHLGDMGANWFDLNNDGLQDVAIGQMSYPTANIHGQERLYILLQNEDGYFDDISYQDLGIFDTMKEAHSMEPIDFDLDGDNDLIFSRQFRDTIDGKETKYMKFYLMKNNIADKSNWSSVKLNAPQNGNKLNIGSRIYLYSNGVAQIREVLAGNGHFGGQDPFIKNFGLGENDGTNFNRIDSIKIRWQTKDESFTKLENPPLNTILDVYPDGSYNFIMPEKDDYSIIGFGSSLTFIDTTYVNTTKTKDISIVNHGNKTLAINDIELIDTSGTFELQNTNFNSQIMPGEEFAIQISFTPEIRHNYSALLKVTSDADNGNIVYHDIKGYGFEEKPIIEFATESIEFDPVFVGEKDTMILAVYNTGEQTLSIFGFQPQDDAFRVLNQSMIEIYLEPGESHHFDVEFAPGDEKVYNSTINILSDAYNTDALEYPVSGIGVLRKSVIGLSSDKLVYLGCDVGDTKSKNITISSSGTKSLIIEDIEFEPGVDDSYYVKDFQPPYTVESGEEITFEVVFEPQEVKSYNGHMRIKSDAYENDLLYVEVSGIGREPASVEYNINQGKDILVKASPNPFSEILSLEIHNSNQFYQKGRIYITDISGIKIAEIEPYGIRTGVNRYLFSPENMSSGKYFVIVELQNEKVIMPIIYRK
jgi:hypothetical protein